MICLVDEERLVATKAEWEAREQEERGLHDVGRKMREIFEPERWDSFDLLEKASRVERAHEQASASMWIQHHTRIVWTDDETDGGAGYEEKNGNIEIPRQHLAKESAGTFAGLVGHELRHAWQWDVIEGRTRAPGGENQRTILKRAYESYDAGDRFRYANSELEIDARDRAAYVIEGFRAVS